jgi:hypothetical protein
MSGTGGNNQAKGGDGTAIVINCLGNALCDNIISITNNVISNVIAGTPYTRGAGVGMSPPLLFSPLITP